MSPVPRLGVAYDPTREAGNDFGEECAAPAEPETTKAGAEQHFRSPSEVLHTRKPRKPISTGIERLDEHTGGGLSPGDSAIFGSGPGGLKTTLFVNIVETMSRPETAICFLAWDERETTVAAKLGARFGEEYATLDSEHPAALESLTGRLEGRGAFVRFVDPASMMPFEDIAETFDRIAPKGRVRIYVIDLLQLMESRTIDEKDTEVIELKKIVEALLRVNRLQESILLVASESTKAAISLEAVEANPLAIFAGSRKMASRFDLPVAMAKTDDVTVKVFVAKNRLGPAGTFLMRLDPATWRVESLREGEAQAQADSTSIRKRKALGKEILRVLPPATSPGLARRRIADTLKARNVKFGNGELGPAIELLYQNGFIVQDDGPNRSLLAKLAIGVDPESSAVKSW
jgi:RecA/RadA recombinase